MKSFFMNFTPVEIESCTFIFGTIIIFTFLLYFLPTDYSTTLTSSTSHCLHENVSTLPHVPDPVARLSALHGPFIWDVLKDSLVKLRNHTTLPKSLWKADFSQCSPHAHTPYSTGKVPRLSMYQPTPLYRKKVTTGKQTCRPSKEAGLNGLCRCVF